MTRDKAAELTGMLIDFVEENFRDKGYQIAELDLALMNVSFYMKVMYMQRAGIEIDIPDDWWKLQSSEER